MSARPTPVAAVQTRAHERSDFADAVARLVARIAAAAESERGWSSSPKGPSPPTLSAPSRSIHSRSKGGARRDRRRSANRRDDRVRRRRAGRARARERAYVVTARGIAGYADKCFLWHFDRRWFTAGDAVEPIDTPAGRLGVFVCADGRIPTIGSALVDRGAEILVMPTAWVTSGRDPHALENLQADLMGPCARARTACRSSRRTSAASKRAASRTAARARSSPRTESVVAFASQTEEANVHATIAVGPSTCAPATVPFRA